MSAGQQFNGRTGEYVRWIMTIIIGGVVAYFTALGTLQAQLAVVVERERNHYDEIIRRLDRIETKVDVSGGVR